MSEKSEVILCPKCGNPMILGRVLGRGTEFAWLLWLESEKKVSKKRGERLESFWNPKGLRAYRCKECGVIICYEKEKIEPTKTSESFLKKCIRCSKEIPIASEECPYCGTEQKNAAKV